ncbi:hypothetical protein OUZ56_013979 [Daphnia magna]|uniref:Uncharacterized protein n=1 Tax=Daphnia magna TaxID=35525 RepID=A0ABQ9Z7I6_9CRUS|nr:hypothetical protein OUZ56_013979 [Daphnia magna]
MEITCTERRRPVAKCGPAGKRGAAGRRLATDPPPLLDIYLLVLDELVDGKGQDKEGNANIQQDECG